MEERQRVKNCKSTHFPMGEYIKGVRLKNLRNDYRGKARIPRENNLDDSTHWIFSGDYCTNFSELMECSKIVPKSQDISLKLKIKMETHKLFNLGA